MYVKCSLHNTNTVFLVFRYKYMFLLTFELQQVCFEYMCTLIQCNPVDGRFTYLYTDLDSHTCLIASENSSIGVSLGVIYICCLHFPRLKALLNYVICFVNIFIFIECLF